VGLDLAHRGRYPHELGHLKDGWWTDAAHVEVLCALVVWRDWIDQAADDPRHELAFHAQLSDYGRELRQEGGGVTRAWYPERRPTSGPTDLRHPRSGHEQNGALRGGASRRSRAR
jgi:hypothetical protein